MIILELLMLSLMLGLSAYASISDIKCGVIANKVLGIFTISAIAADIIYYDMLVPALFVSFILNVVIITVLSVLLFVTHSWAGGDCKLLCVLALLYPGRLYVAYSETTYTLVFTVCAAFVAGYLYLIADTLHDLIKKKTSIIVSAISKKLLKFIISYITVLVYITSIHLVYSLFVSQFIYVNAFALSAVCIAIGLISTRVSFFKNKIFISFVLLFDVSISIITKMVPIGMDYKTYAIVLFAAILGAIISGNNSEDIPTSSVKKGTILTTATTMLFIQSNVKDLPEISTEDLRSRLTEKEAAGVIRWENSKYGQPTVSIVRKIPFAIFISTGFIAYLILWSVL